MELRPDEVSGGKKERGATTVNQSTGKTYCVFILMFLTFQSALLYYTVLRETKCSLIPVEIRGTLVAGVEDAVYRFNEFQIKACVREMVMAATDF